MSGWHEPGVWTLGQVEVEDYLGNYRRYEPGELAGIGTFTITGTPDLTPPEVHSIVVTPDSAPNTDLGVFTLAITVSDDVSGVSSVGGTYTGPSTSKLFSISGCCPFDPAPYLGGVVTKQIEIWPGTDPGRFQLTELRVVDRAGRVWQYSASELADTVRFEPFDVTGQPDTAPPAIVGIAVSPSEVDTGVDAAIAFDFTVTDDASGVDTVEFRGRSLDGTATFRVTPVRDPIAGTRQDGVFRGIVYLDAWEEPVGEWQLTSVTVRDRVGRTVSFSRDELLAAGISVPSFFITGDPDDTPPAIVAAAFRKPVLLAPDTTMFDVTYSDAESGIRSIGVWISNGWVERLDDGATVTTGTINTGVWSFPFTFSHLYAGVWELDRIEVEDRRGNRTIYTGAELEAAGVPLGVTSVAVGGRPSPPLDLEVSTGSPGELVVAWEPAAYEGTDPITGYRVEVRPAGPLQTVADESTSGTSAVPDIVGGSETPISAYPWQGALLVADEVDAGMAQFCGVALVAPRVALTAAHCVVEAVPGSLSVAFGETYLSAVSVVDRVPVTGITVHPDFDKDSMTGDIAVLQLAAPPRGGQPINLITDPALPPANVVAWATGWGVYRWDSQYYYLADGLRVGELLVLAAPGDPVCGQWGDVYVPELHLCAGGGTWYRHGTCYGDSGGPLAVHSGAYRWALAGITSFGAAPESGDCGYPDLPSVFTRVSAYASWVAQVDSAPGWTTVSTGMSSPVIVGGLEPGYEYEVRVSTISAQDSLGPVVARAHAGGVVSYFPWPDRLSGSDRFGTAAAIAAATFPDPVDTVFVATGFGFADALAGAAVAGRLGAPLLLVGATSVPPATAAELSRLDPDRIVILGGIGVIAESVATALGSYAPTVIRIAGANRFETAVAISRYGFPEDGSADQVVIATGYNFADALAGAPVAAALGGPVLLTNATDLPGVVVAEIQRLAPQRVVVLGGVGAVSAAVYDQLALLAPEVVRYAGSDRYATAVAANLGVFSSATTAYVATGLNYPDALAGAAAAAYEGAPLFLVAGSSVPGGVMAAMEQLGVSHIVILGGSAVVSDGVWIILGTAFGPN